MSHSRPNAALIADPGNIEYVYGRERIGQIAQRTKLLSGPMLADAVTGDPTPLAGVEVIFSTWKAPRLTYEQLDMAPDLRAVFHAAGTVEYFARPFLERGITVVSAWRANALSVAHFTIGQILLANKGYFRNLREYDGSTSAFHAAFRGAGNYGSTVAILGAGAVGRSVMELLRPFEIEVIVFDPFLDKASAEAMGVEKVATLAEAFARGYVVSNHLADKSETVDLIDEAVLSLLVPDATFINTGRGRTVDHAALLDLLLIRPDVTALLDVTHPEPLGMDSPLSRLPNVRITSHISGSVNNEVGRMADLCIREFDSFAAGAPLQHQVTLEALAAMA